MSTYDAMRKLTSGEIVGIIDGSTNHSPGSGAGVIKNGAVEDEECIDEELTDERAVSLG